jgi:demethylmenaquinone methyltransferase/2-methoxy-6-polyprenyl-1,4-benzoquinol methylase
MENITPYNNSDSKKKQVRDMFNNIAGTYDGLNRIISLGIDKSWRKKAIRILAKQNPSWVLDIATGTGDFAIEASKIKGTHIIGVDIAEDMLEVGRKKIEQLKLTQQIQLATADSENLPFEDNKFDAVLVSFGVRNFENLELGLSEIFRVLKKGGIFIVLEASSPQKQPFKWGYQVYSNTLLPFIGKLVSKDKNAYSYLPTSIEAFPAGEKFTTILQKVGFTQTSHEALTLGVCTLYTARKQ